MPSEREQYWFDRLKVACGDELSGRAYRPHKRPDFLVEQDDRVLGIELTEFQISVPPGQRPKREVMAFRDWVIVAAKHTFETAYRSPVKVSVFFVEGYGPRSDRQNLAARIAHAALAHIGEIRAPFDTVEVPCDQLPEEVGEIVITGLPSGIDSLWSALDWQWQAPVGAEDILAQVARKEKQLAACRRKCDSLWLVIINDIFSHGEAVELVPGVSGSLSHPLLDRMYWIDPAAPRVVRLQ